MRRVRPGACRVAVAWASVLHCMVMTTMPRRSQVRLTDTCTEPQPRHCTVICCTLDPCLMHTMQPPTSLPRAHHATTQIPASSLNVIIKHPPTFKPATLIPAVVRQHVQRKAATHLHHSHCHTLQQPYRFRPLHTYKPFLLESRQLMFIETSNR